MINFKAYAQGMGRKAIRIALAAEEVAQETGVEIIVVPNAVDLVKVKEAVGVPVFAQHVDAVHPGAHTGSILPEMLKEWGIDGTLINHSEHQVTLPELEYTIARSQELGLDVIACATDERIADAIADLRPTAVAVEPPELIGGNVSVSTARPEVIERAVALVQACSSVPVLVGAGVKTAEDVRKAIELGASGVLVASGVVKAKDPKKAIEELAKGIP